MKDYIEVWCLSLINASFPVFVWNRPSHGPSSHHLQQPRLSGIVGMLCFNIIILIFLGYILLFPLFVDLCPKQSVSLLLHLFVVSPVLFVGCAMEFNLLSLEFHASSGLLVLIYFGWTNSTLILKIWVFDPLVEKTIQKSMQFSLLGLFSIMISHASWALSMGT